MNGDTNRRWKLARRPHGTISESDFIWEERPVQMPVEGEVLVRVTMLMDIQEGLKNAPAMLHRLFEGPNEGKQLLRVAS